MGNLLQDGAGWLAGVLRGSCSLQVVYRRGAQLALLQATYGDSLLRVVDGAGNARTVRTDRDFLFVAADLEAAGITLPPQRGDLVDAMVGGVAGRYELLPYGRDEPVYQNEDTYGTMLRVRTKYRGPPT